MFRAQNPPGIEILALKLETYTNLWCVISLNPVILFLLNEHQPEFSARIEPEDNYRSTFSKNNSSGQRRRPVGGNLPEVGFSPSDRLFCSHVTQDFEGPPPSPIDAYQNNTAPIHSRRDSSRVYVDPVRPFKIPSLLLTNTLYSLVTSSQLLKRSLGTLHRVFGHQDSLRHMHLPFVPISMERVITALDHHSHRLENRRSCHQLGIPLLDPHIGLQAGIMTMAANKINLKAVLAKAQWILMTTGGGRLPLRIGTGRDSMIWTFRIIITRLALRAVWASGTMIATLKCLTDHMDYHRILSCAMTTTRMWTIHLFKAIPIVVAGLIHSLRDAPTPNGWSRAEEGNLVPSLLMNHIPSAPVCSVITNPFHHLEMLHLREHPNPPVLVDSDRPKQGLTRSRK